MRVFLAFLTSLALSAQADVTSRYTDMDKDCGDAIDESSVPSGSDIPQDCKGPGGYRIYESYSLFSSVRGVVDGKGGPTVASLHPEDCPIASYGRMVEWRLRGNTPFAVIQRVSCRDQKEDGSGAGRKLGEWLVVQELQGAKRKQQVDATKPNANAKAREIADGF
ncbi:MAG TPA: hypothetical protein PKO15_09755 [Fibrobacteria bacterium]|nr:hypothetical protein [Fibrobacteria bacterium]HOX51859.1 hypothetical protein [Fibrobacteria bacterium]